MNLAKIGRLWQFAAIAVATHVGTRHAMIWGHPEGEGHPEIFTSWARLIIGISVAIILFWTGVYLENRAKKTCA